MKKNNPSSADPYSGIYCFNETGDAIPIDQSRIEQIISLVEASESCNFQLVEIAFVDEDAIVAINKEHLERGYVTDIITFRYDENESNEAVEGTLYCCVSRIAEQADEFGQTAKQEFDRIVIHGLLHLVGYDDQSDATRQKMRTRENFYLDRLS